MIFYRGVDVISDDSVDILDSKIKDKETIANDNLKKQKKKKHKHHHKHKKHTTDKPEK